MARYVKQPGIISQLRNGFSNATKFKKAVLLVSLCLFTAALTQPAFYIDRADPAAYSNGIFLLLLGWLGVMGGGFEGLAWAANPLYFIAIVFFIKSRKVAGVLAAGSMFFALLFMMARSIITDEAGNKSKITSVEMGYKLWVASMIVLFVGILIDRFLYQKTNAKKADNANK